MNELSIPRLGSMNVLTVTPVIPPAMSAGTPNVVNASEGSVPEVNTSVTPERRNVQNHRLKIVARVGHPHVVDAKEGKQWVGGRDKVCVQLHTLTSSGSAWATGLVANGMSPAARKAPAAVPRTSVIRRALIGDSNR